MVHHFFFCSEMILSLVLIMLKHQCTYDSISGSGSCTAPAEMLTVLGSSAMDSVDVVAAASAVVLIFSAHIGSEVTLDAALATTSSLLPLWLHTGS